MAQKRPAQLEPGFLGLKETKGVMLFIPFDQPILLPAMLMTQRTIYGTFGIACTVIILYQPREQLAEQREKDIRDRKRFFLADGVRLLTAMYVNVRDCHPDTIRFTESLSMKTLHLDVDVQVSNIKEMARKAIIEILKAI